MIIQNGWLILDQWRRIRMSSVVAYDASERGVTLTLAGGSEWRIPEIKGEDLSARDLLDKYFQSTP